MKRNKMIKRRYIKTIALFLLLIVGSRYGFSQVDASKIENPKDKGLSNWVSNQDNILNQTTVNELNNKINTLYEQTSAQIVVVAISGDEQTSARDLSMDLFDKWKIGQKGKDNGLLILLVVNSRQCFIRTGYGLEGAITDAVSSDIANSSMKPFFKDGNWNEGIINGTDACIKVINKEYKENGEAGLKPATFGDMFMYYLPYIIGYFIICIVYFVFALKSIKNKVKHISDNFKLEKMKALQQASTMWGVWSIIFIFSLPLLLLWVDVIAKNKIRKARVICSCGGKMRRLSEKEEDMYLDKTEQLEETLKSMDYDVWLCEKCKQTVIYPYKKKSSYIECPVCKAKTYIKTNEKILRYATATEYGLMEKTYFCSNCGHEGRERMKLPHTSAGGFIVTGGGFGSGSGGSFGGGFSGGSFGGGMSGGGGGGCSF
jgi:uncharacterized protein